MKYMVLLGEGPVARDMTLEAAVLVVKALMIEYSNVLAEGVPIGIIADPGSIPAGPVEPQVVEQSPESEPQIEET